MDTRERPTTEEPGTWLEGRDILPANTPAHVSTSQPPPVPPPAAPERRTRPWSLILGVPLLILLVLGAVWLVGSAGSVRSGLLGVLPGHAAAAATAQPTIRAASSVGGDPLLSARVEARRCPARR
jgi:hypothetical protein